MVVMVSASDLRRAPACVRCWLGLGLGVRALSLSPADSVNRRRFRLTSAACPRPPASRASAHVAWPRPCPRPPASRASAHVARPRQDVDASTTCW